MMNRLFLLLSSLLLISADTTTPNTGDQLQAFTFSYYTTILQPPILASCPTPLTLTQGYPTNAGGPDPASPYTMVVLAHEQLEDGSGIQYERIYSRSLDVGSLSALQSIPHPFANGTQFIACIWASNKVSGGCQDLITVYESPLTDVAYQNASSQCRSNVTGSWVTPMNQTLDVAIAGLDGLVAENGWPATCSDLMFTPKNGTGPYTLLIAPAFHPPVNISSNTTFASDNSMNYTIRLTHGQAFMAAVYDSLGNSWAIGPLHAGAATDLSCLQVATGQTYIEPTQPGSSGIAAGALAGGIVGAFIVGAVGAALLLWLLFIRRKNGRVGSYILARTREDLDPYTNPRPDLSRNESMFLKAPTPFSGPESPPLTGDWDSPEADHSLEYDPQRAYREQMGLGDFHPPLHSGSSSNPSQRSHDSWTSAQGGTGGTGGSGFAGLGTGTPRTKGRVVADEQRSPATVAEGESEEDGRPGRSVYVVHSDGGGGNVTIRLPEGVANVVELPPQYRNEQAALAAGNSTAQPEVQNTAPTGNANPTSSSLDHSLLVPFLAPSPPPRDGNGSTVSSASRASGVHGDELRARAEAARGEKAPRQ